MADRVDSANRLLVMVTLIIIQALFYIEEKYTSKENLKQVLHHGHEVDETGVSEIVKNTREFLIYAT